VYASTNVVVLFNAAMVLSSVIHLLFVFHMLIMYK